MPIGRLKSREGPRYPFMRKPLEDVLVGGDVTRIVKIQKFKLMNGPIKRKRD